jgi:hypothetical protein
MEIQLYHIINKRFKLKNHPFDILVKNFTQTILSVTEPWKLKITMLPNQRILVYATNGKQEHQASYNNMFDAVHLIYYLHLQSKL